MDCIVLVYTYGNEGSIKHLVFRWYNRNGSGGFQGSGGGFWGMGEVSRDIEDAAADLEKP